MNEDLNFFAAELNRGDLCNNLFLSMLEAGRLECHHAATGRGYISAKKGLQAYRYFGKFGNGFRVDYCNRYGALPNSGKASNRFYRVEYWIIKD
jgi:hypothetical protein